MWLTCLARSTRGFSVMLTGGQGGRGARRYRRTVSRPILSPTLASACQAPLHAEAPLLGGSQVGNDRFLHGRPHIRTLGLYDHRARFYEPGTQLFLEPDPLGPVDSPNLYQAFGFDGLNVVDPWGMKDGTQQPIGNRFVNWVKGTWLVRQVGRVFGVVDEAQTNVATLTRQAVDSALRGDGAFDPHMEQTMEEAGLRGGITGRPSQWNRELAGLSGEVVEDVTKKTLVAATELASAKLPGAVGKLADDVAPVTRRPTGRGFVVADDVASGKRTLR